MGRMPDPRGTAPLRSRSSVRRRHLSCASVILAALSLVAACGDDGASDIDAGRDSGAEDASANDTGVADAGRDSVAADAGADAAVPDPGCARPAAAADRQRFVVVSHPFAEEGGPASRYEVLPLAADGTLSQPGTFFDLGDRPAAGSEIVFTPDGRVGLVALSNGKLGVFSLDEAGAVTVVHLAFEGLFYAGGVVVDPSGSRAYVLDHDVMPARGGGVYEVAIHCDGTLANMGRVLAAAGPRTLRPHEDGRWVMTARSVEGGESGDDLFTLAPGRPFTLLAGADAFGDDDAITTDLDITADGRFAIVGDNSLFVTHRVAVVSLDGPDLAPVGVISPIADPAGVVASPFGDTAIVVSGVDGDAIFVLDQSAGSFSLRGELAYAGPRPQLPANAVMVRRGSLSGLVLVAENLGIRRVRFDGGGVVTDLGAHSTGSGIPAIVGILGVTP